ncbi:helix-turn-helix transcriptional regulator [Pseudomonas abietaniphila]|uniref:Transcriptional regulator, AraC family n=1 Tax=Pseudomonas abietaniphila TaxID=89065 RepID=A0A1G7SAF0_9PSED|nr:AraC family transcriptional regulator [Pseudomonas abietaniphila]SDG19963.1 transcriptional regulator, AraC family [Pseudomonas abietaniphila]
MPLQNPVNRSAIPVFWRDAQLPFIEARSIADGRKVCYSRHSHDVFSIGAITSGFSTYLHEKTDQRISTGTVVWMNPGDVHACNPIDDQLWSYIMLYVDAQWLGRVQQACGINGFRPIPGISSSDPTLFSALLDLHQTLIDPALDALEKHEAAIVFFTLMQQRPGGADVPLKKVNAKVERAAQYINQHFLRAIRLEEICQVANLSEAYLIRAFEQHYHMTPHAYLINRRIQHAQAQLREGAPIADIAQQNGFSDQAHFQRVFKKHLAATPGQYRQ